MSETTHVRHGLYLPVDLLDQLRLLAQRKKKSMNKQIEEIITEWFALKRKTSPVSRKALLKLPLERRHELLREQAKRLRDEYAGESEFAGGQTDLFEYD